MSESSSRPSGGVGVYGEAPLAYGGTPGGDSDDDVFAEEELPAPAEFNTHTLLQWAYQVAKGMEYLSFRKVRGATVRLGDHFITIVR